MELKLMEKKILEGMDFHAREPISIIARRLKMSKQRVIYNINKLEKEGIIQGYYADINPSKLGITIYLIYLTFQKISTEKEETFINHLNNSLLSLNVSTQGKWDHSFAILAKDIYEFREKYSTIMKSYEQYIKDKRITLVTDFWYYQQRFDNEEKREHSAMNGPSTKMSLDNIDNKILRMLGENARISLLELSEHTKLTPNAVRSRIKSLEKNKVILSYRVMINYNKIGKLHYRIFFFLKNDLKRQEELRGFLGNILEVISITKTEGYADIEIRLITKDLDDFHRIITNIRRLFSDIINEYEPLLYYKFHKSLNYYPID
ncbi:MAG: Lrp/AsnC family transcriptional regulator [Nanoarchaeota archaeon]